MKPTKFKLPYKSFRKDLSSVLDLKAVVVSFFGKSPYNLSSCKAGLVDNFLYQSIFIPSVLDDPVVDSETLCEIDGYYNSKQNVLYLHLCGIFDTHTLVKQYERLAVDLEEKGFLSVWAQLKHGYARSLLFLFSVSHILVITHPSQGFDISYIHLFRALDNVRLKLQTCISETLGKIPGVNSDWAYNGRLCSPRVLFLFQACPSAFRKKPKDGRSVNIKKLEHALEDQIYHILRKSRIITNISSNSLFAIPANQEFVFVEVEQEVTYDWTPFLVNSLVDLCKNNTSNAEPNHCNFGYESLHMVKESKNSNTEHSFQKFLQQHIDQALLRGFDDNVGRHLPSNPYFVIPTVGVWMEVANVLYRLIITNGLLEKGSSANSVLHNLLDTDVKFSEARCNKVLPLAIATYQENLPTHYTKEYHEGKVAHALSVFGVHARGPLVDNYVTQLENDCERHWKSGRQMCEVLSLTGNPCTKPLHTGGSGEPSIHEADSSSKAELPVMEHCSGVRYISACDCGRKQGSREDPFTVRTANYDFYQLLGTECGCDLLDRIHFPVFQPSTKDYKAAQLFSDSSRGINRKDSQSVIVKDFSNQHGNTQGLSLAYVSVHSGDGDSDLMIGGTNLNADAATAHPRISDISLTEHSHHIVIQVSDADIESSKEKFLVRQPSTTEYLPGMLHTESPGTLLPQFPSWSLVCLGPSSLYSHNLGLQEQQQAGLLIGSAYLLPWDVTVRLEQQQKDKFWPAVGDPSRLKQSQTMGLSKGRKSKGTKDQSEFNVKIFVGVEYECPRGHRFMCSAPDKVLKTSGTGLVKDNGNKVTGCDMPLYFPCPCMSTKPLIAQLMRVHVVTPKAPVHVTLNPKVQPAPSPCPVFVTGCQEPMRLSQSAYWVLRLPYVYVGDRGPYLPPKDPVPSDYGRLLAGMYGIVEISDSKL